MLRPYSRTRSAGEDRQDRARRQDALLVPRARRVVGSRRDFPAPAPVVAPHRRRCVVPDRHRPRDRAEPPRGSRRRCRRRAAAVPLHRRRGAGGHQLRASRADTGPEARQHRPTHRVARCRRVGRRREQRRLARSLFHEQPLRVSQCVVPEPRRRHVRRRRRGRRRRERESPRRRRVDGCDMGRLRQRRARGPVDLQVGLPPALQEHATSTSKT